MGQSASSVFRDTIYTNFALGSWRVASIPGYKSKLYKCTLMCMYYASCCHVSWDAEKKRVVVTPPNPLGWFDQLASDSGVHWATLFYISALEDRVNYNMYFQMIVDTNVEVMLQHVCTVIVRDLQQEQEKEKKKEKVEASGSRAAVDLRDFVGGFRSMSYTRATQIVAAAVYLSFNTYASLMLHHMPSVDRMYDDPESQDYKVVSERLEHIRDILRYCRSRHDVLDPVSNFNDALRLYMTR